MQPGWLVYTGPDHHDRTQPHPRTRALLSRGSLQKAAPITVVPKVEFPYNIYKGDVRSPRPVICPHPQVVKLVSLAVSDLMYLRLACSAGFFWEPPRTPRVPRRALRLRADEAMVQPGADRQRELHVQGGHGLPRIGPHQQGVVFSLGQHTHAVPALGLLVPRGMTVISLLLSLVPLADVLC